MQLGAGEVGVGNQSGFVPDHVGQTVRLEPLDEGRGAPALPYDGVIHRFSALLVPQQRGFPLVGNAYGLHIFRVYPGLFHYALQGGYLGVQDIRRIMFHPTGVGVDLFEFHGAGSR